MKNKFWKWKVRNNAEEKEERILQLYGEISDDTWFGDEVSPALFRDELRAGSGDISVWINSPGGDCFAAAEIYNMLLDYPGRVNVIIDSLAASAASVIAMAGDTVTMSPVAMMMIHNPATVAIGDSREMEKAADMLSEVKESIINAYERKTGLSREKLSAMMDGETWMNAKKAVELGFADGILKEDEEEFQTGAMLFSRAAVTNSLLSRLMLKNSKQTEKTNIVDAGQLQKRLSLIMH